MPWTNQGGGSGGSGDSGGSNGSGPWGSRGGSRGGPRGGPQGAPPNLEDLLRESQEKFRGLLPGGGRGIFVVFLVGVALWLASGFYVVDTEEQGVVLRFGKWVRTTQPGLHYHLPGPIETVYTPPVTSVNRMEVGFRSSSRGGGAGATRQVPEESLMLTGDENIVDINFTVFWVIKDAGEFLFNIRNPEITVKSVAESAMREVIGQTRIELIFAKGRQEVVANTKALMQSMLNDYGAGVEIRDVQLQKADPPESVIDAFRDVQRAKADQVRLKNQAEAYQNSIVPQARGEAAKIVEGAEAYKREVVARSEGDAQRFLAVYKAYAVAKDVTRKRIYLETMEKIMGNMNKVIIDGNASDVVPYLPLPELQKRQKVKEAPALLPSSTTPEVRSGEGG